jgi:hypothetical protein
MRGLGALRTLPKAFQTRSSIRFIRLRMAGFVVRDAPGAVSFVE